MDAQLKNALEALETLVMYAQEDKAFNNPRKDPERYMARVIAEMVLEAAER